MGAGINMFFIYVRLILQYRVLVLWHIYIYETNLLHGLHDWDEASEFHVEGSQSTPLWYSVIERFCFNK